MKVISGFLTIVGVLVIINAFLSNPLTSIHQIYVMANYIFGMLILILAKQLSR